MNINTKTTNIEMTEAISNYVDKKVGMLQKFFNDTEEVLVNVEVGKTTKHHKSGDYFRAEIHLLVGGKDYYATAETDDLYASIDKVKDDISSELSSNKKKSLRLFRKGALKIKMILKGIVEVGDRGWKKIRRKK
jgi:putative sigma-54 modulation protein